MQYSEGNVQIFQLLSGRDIAKDVKNNQLHYMAHQMANYAYVVVIVFENESGGFLGEATIIDGGGWDVAGIIDFCKQKKFLVKQCLFTHRHFDHVGGRLPRQFSGGRNIVGPGVKEYVDMNIPVFVGQGDVEAVAQQCQLDIKRINSIVDRQVVSLANGKASIKCLLTPGHTPGSACFLVKPEDNQQSNKNAFMCTGDTLFIGSCGRIDLPESDARAMMHSLFRLAKLPETEAINNIFVLPGHNYAAPTISSIREEKEINGMMIQALNSVQKEQRTAGLQNNETLSQNFIQLPDYIGVAKKVFAMFNTSQTLTDEFKLLESKF